MTERAIANIMLLIALGSWLAIAAHVLGGGGRRARIAAAPINVTPINAAPINVARILVGIAIVFVCSVVAMMATFMVRPSGLVLVASVVSAGLSSWLAGWIWFRGVDLALRRDAAAVRRFRSGHLSDEPVLDLNFIDMLGAEVGRRALPQIARLFVEEMHKRFRQLREAQETVDLALLERTCHAIAGSAATLGARRLATLCQNVEHGCAREPSLRHFECVGLIRAEIGLVFDALKAIPELSATPVEAV